MQVFKLFFKVLNKYKGSMIMYTCIFASILTIMVKVNSGNTQEYQTRKCDYIIFDYDNSEVSKAFADYVEKNEEKSTVKIKDDKREIQDALYYSNIDCAIRIPDGFGQAVKDGNAEGMLDIVTIPGTSVSSFFERKVDVYFKTLEAYLKADMDIDSAISKTNEIMKISVDVSLPDGSDTGDHSVKYQYFLYLGWILVVVMITSISPVVQVFSRDEIKRRIECSSYKFFKMNREIFLGMVISGLVFCLVIVAIAIGFFRKDVFNEQFLYWVLNMLCYLLVALSIAFLLAKVTKDENILNMLANIISLGMAFLCGIFVPREFLGEGVLKVAKFLPAYWYGEATSNIDLKLANAKNDIFIAFGIQILFAVAITVVGMMISKRKVSE